MTSNSQQIEQIVGQNIIKHNIRYDLEIIANLVKANSKVLDIGCGNGELLQYLKEHKNIDGRGLEISQQQITKALERGISAVQGDAEKDLGFYPDNNFDFAILSQTIQATKNPKAILQEMLRIAKYAIVSLPNFANFRNRFHLLFKGTMPVNKTIPFQWYDTPNIHFCSVKDFENLCLEMNFTIEKKQYLTSKHRLLGVLGNDKLANFCAEYGIFLITKNQFNASTQEEFTFNKKMNFPLISAAKPAYNRSKNC